MMAVAAARIGTGVGFFVAGAVFLGIGAFAGLGGQAAFATMCAILGGSLIAVGFWVRLFGMVERRLIDIERRLGPGPVEVEPEKPKEPVADIYYG